MISTPTKRACSTYFLFSYRAYKKILKKKKTSNYTIFGPANHSSITGPEEAPPRSSSCSQRRSKPDMNTLNSINRLEEIHLVLRTFRAIRLLVNNIGVCFAPL